MKKRLVRSATLAAALIASSLSLSALELGAALSISPSFLYAGAWDPASRAKLSRSTSARTSPAS
jgi:hypothetical protein